MTKLIVSTHNVETGEITEREATDEEIAQQEIDEANFKARQAEIKTKAEAKAAALVKLAALGLTVEDLQALGL
jgi:hypothetical protein